MSLRIPLVFVLVVAAACARRVPPLDPWLAEAAEADRLIEAGCYTCLREAFDIYERGLVIPRRAARAASGAFTAALLLAAREKELGLEAAAWIERARLRLPQQEASVYIEIVEALRWEHLGGAWDFEATLTFNDADVTRFRAFLERPEATGVLDRYLRVAAGCTFRQDPSAPIPLAAEAASHPPIVQYRVGLCGRGEQAHLYAARSREPRLVEARFFLGRFLIAEAPDRLGRALPDLTAAHDGLPQVPIFAVTLAGVHRARHELDRALELYEHALAIRPAQRDALIGRAITLTYMGRHADAIETCSRLLELGRWYIADAYYWRAWNEYALRDLASAATDAAAAKKGLANGSVFTLSGMIAFDQQRLPDAKADFETARRVDSANCTAAWYLGLIEVENAAWPAATAAFLAATTCYGNEAEGIRDEIKQLPDDLQPATRAQQVAERERRIAESLRQEARAAFNAAQGLVRLGDRTRAAEYAAQAARHTTMKEKAEALLKTLEKR